MRLASSPGMRVGWMGVCVLVAFVAGCSGDDTLFDADGGDAGRPDGGGTLVDRYAPPPVDGQVEAGGEDVANDVSTDDVVDTGPSSNDGGGDDAGDAGGDAGVDAEGDAEVDAEGDAGSDAGSDAAFTVDANVPLGTLTFNADLTHNQFVFIGDFYATEAQALATECAQTSPTVGGCAAFSCSIAVDAGAQASAGTINIKGGTLPATGFDLSPLTGATEYLHEQTTPMFAGGDTLTVSAAGAAVPAFDVNITAVGAVTFSAPALPGPDAGPLVVPTSSDLVVTWTGGVSGASIDVNLLGEQSGTIVGVSCLFDATAGTGTVPASAMSVLSGTSGDFFAGQTSIVSFTAGSFPSELSTYVYVNENAQYQ